MFGFFERLVTPFSMEPAGNHPDSVVGFIRYHIVGLKRYMLLVALLSTCTAATEVYIFSFLGHLVDSIRTTDHFVADNQGILTQIGLILLVGLPIVVSAHTLLWQQTLAGNLPVRILSSVHQYLIKQSVQFFHSEAAGKVANTLVQTVESTKLILLKSIDTFMFAFVFFVSMGLMLSRIDLFLLVPVIIWIVGYVLVIAYFVPKLKEWSNKQARSKSEMIGQVVDTYTNIATVKLFSHSTVERSFAHDYMSKYLHTINGQTRFISKIQFFLWSLNIFLIFGTIVASLELWGRGLISVGAIAAAVGVSFRVYTMSHWILWEVAGLFSNIGVVQDGIKLLSRPLPQAARASNSLLEVDSYDISFTDVDFAYPGCDKAIRGLSLNIRAGEKVGIVGRSGSGKSTLTKLLLRFYEVGSGDICIGGQSIRSVSHESLLEKIAVVAQDVEILDRSIRENLTYGRVHVSDAEMIGAAKAAGAHDFILQLSDESGSKGYDARIGVRGAKLSGGQRQRISLARALLKDAPIIIFDEPTSALDSEVEFLVMELMKNYVEKKTVIMIAHRLTTLAKMDRLAVIDRGELIELGTHDELKSRNGLYSQFLTMQSEDRLKGVVWA